MPITTVESPKLYYRPVEAAKATGLNRTAIFDALAKRSLPSFKIGRARLIAKDDLVAFVNSHKEVA